MDYQELFKKINYALVVMPESCQGCLCGVSDCTDEKGNCDCEGYKLMKPLYEMEQQLSKLQQEKEQTINEIENLKQFYIEQFKNTKITFIPLSNLTKNIDILLLKLKGDDK